MGYVVLRRFIGSYGSAGSRSKGVYVKVRVHVFGPDAKEYHARPQRHVHGISASDAVFRLLTAHCLLLTSFRALRFYAFTGSSITNRVPLGRLSCMVMEP